MIQSKILFLITLLSFQYALGNKIHRNENLIVETNVGLIRGVRPVESDYTMFMGIPYATVNESNIFGDSIPYPPFEEIFEAYDDSKICPQVEEFNSTTVGTLDCLNINIYVPDSASAQNQLPVMVYIYGGGFVLGFAGSFLYGPKYLVRHDVILVTFNYRLGPYGFLCLDTPEVPGNAGMKDQVTALRWIQNNIGAFGGDTERVTLFGNSAGAMSIGYHLISETEKLFTSVIMQSGSAFVPGQITEGDTSVPITIAEELGFSTNDVNEALSFLANADVHAVVEVSSALYVCVEKSFPGVETFLGKHAIHSNHSKVADIGIMLGYNSEEALALLPDDPDSPLWPFFGIMFHELLSLGFNFEPAMLQELESIVRRFYIGDEEVTEEVGLQIMDFVSDYTFIYSSIRCINIFLNAGSDKVYQYLFAHDGERNFVKVKDNITRPGVAHADEIGYLFEMDFIPAEPNSEDQLIIDRTTMMWTNFAKYGDPTPETTVLLPVKWEPVTKESPYHYIIINSTMSADQRYEHRRMSFWELFYNAYETYEDGFLVNNQEEEEDEDTQEGSDEDLEENIESDENESVEDSGEPDAASAAYLSSILGTMVAISILTL